MNQNEAITEILHCFNTSLFTTYKNFALWLINRHFHCLPKKQHPHEALFLINISRDEIEKGLTSSKWSLIESLVRQLIKEKRI